MWEKMVKQAVLLLVLMFFCGIFRTTAPASCQDEESVQRTRRESSVFREMELSEEALISLNELLEEGYEPGRLLSVLLPWRNFRISAEDLSGTGSLFAGSRRNFRRYRSLELSRFQKAMSAVWDDLEEFPVELRSLPTKIPGFLSGSFGGERQHEGCDLMPPENQRDFYPVRSMTDGAGGKDRLAATGGLADRHPRKPWRLFLLCPSLFVRSCDFQKGDLVSAGDLLGYMGDSGYGPEGTTGRFDVHLHIGIYIEGENRKRSV